MTIQIGTRTVGPGHRTYVIAEIGINHNGSADMACRLIDAAKAAGCDAVKFQKRGVSAVYTREELDKPRESPWGKTAREQKYGLELKQKDYDLIDSHCKSVGIDWFASCWDSGSLSFIRHYCPPCYKIHSAAVTDLALIRETCRVGKPILLSTGMSTLDEVDSAVQVIRSMGNPLAILHCTSTYPAVSDELNLACIPMLAARYGVPVGYSGHEVGLATTLAAVALGACVVERHITLDRTAYGSDQASSIEPHGFAHLTRDISEIEKAMGDGVKRVYESEIPIRAKLRRVLA